MQADRVGRVWYSPIHSTRLISFVQKKEGGKKRKEERDGKCSSIRQTDRQTASSLYPPTWCLLLAPMYQANASSLAPFRHLEKSLGSSRNVWHRVSCSRFASKLLQIPCLHHHHYQHLLLISFRFRFYLLLAGLSSLTLPTSTTSTISRDISPPLDRRQALPAWVPGRAGTRGIDLCFRLWL